MTPFQRAYTPEEQFFAIKQEMFNKWLKGDPEIRAAFTEQHAPEAYRQITEHLTALFARPVYRNDLYQVTIFDDGGEIIHLSIKRNDRKPIEKSSPQSIILNLGCVGACSKKMLGLIAVPTENLETCWESLLNQPPIKMPTTTSGESKEFPPVFITATVSVIDGKEDDFCFSATSTFTAVSKNNALFQRNSHLFAKFAGMSSASLTEFEAGQWLPASTPITVTEPDSLFLDPGTTQALLHRAGFAGLKPIPSRGATTDACAVRLFWSCHAPMINCIASSLNKIQFNHIGWRDLQEIKNELVGPEHEAIEIYPAESKRVDSANQYHLWVFKDPTYRIPIGFQTRLVTEGTIGLSQQRPFEKHAL